MLQSFAQFGVAFLEFFKQPDILDRDHRLVREGLEKGNLLVSEGTDLRPADRYGTDGDILAQKRRGQRRSNTERVSTPMLNLAPLRMLNFAPSHYVLNVYSLPVEYGTAGEEVTADCPALADRHEACWDHPITRDLPRHVALNANDLSII